MAFLSVICTVTIVFGCLNGMVNSASRKSNVVLVNNQYQNVLVAIDPTVPEDPKLISSIKDAFTMGSSYLYNATNHRAAFGSVTIVVPSTWKADPSYIRGTADQIYNNADVIFTSPLPAPPIDSRSPAGLLAKRSSDLVTSSRVSAATTRAYAGCGQQAIRITLTTDILTNPKLKASLGSVDRVLVHNWAHFRWGVFDEYGKDGEPQAYFSITTGKLEAIRCTMQIYGYFVMMNLTTGLPVRDRTGPMFCRDVDSATGLFPENCRYVAPPAGPAQESTDASVMDNVKIQAIVKFCDDSETNPRTVHNYEAPSRHNRLCGHRSTWDVISQSDDFKNNANTPRPGMKTVPAFQVVQSPATHSVVLALDASDSMAADQKLTLVRQAASTFVQIAMEPAAPPVGIATFDDTVVVRKSLLAWNSSSDKHSVADYLPDSTHGTTNISAVLLNSVHLLSGEEETSVSSPLKTDHLNRLSKISAHTDGSNSKITEGGERVTGSRDKRSLRNASHTRNLTEHSFNHTTVRSTPRSIFTSRVNGVIGKNQAANLQLIQKDLHTTLNTTKTFNTHVPSASSRSQHFRTKLPNNTNFSHTFTTHSPDKSTKSHISSTPLPDKSTKSHISRTPLPARHHHSHPFKTPLSLRSSPSRLRMTPASSKHQTISRRATEIENHPTSPSGKWNVPKESIRSTSQPDSSGRRGGHLVVVTDGEETNKSDVTSTLPLLQKSGVAVSFIVLGGPPMPELEHVAQRTGGRVYCDSNQLTSTGTMDAFFDMTSMFEPRTTSVPIQLLSRAAGLHRREIMEGEVGVDENVGSGTTFMVTYTQTVPKVTIRSPMYRVYTAAHPEYSLDDRLKIIKVAIPSVAEHGRWRYEVANLGNFQKVSIFGITNRSNSSSLPALLTGTLIAKGSTRPTSSVHMFAEMTRDRNPVTNLKVFAEVDTPTGDLVKVELMDNGAGADIAENDGIYSRYFVHLSGPGLYTVRMSASGYWNDEFGTLQTSSYSYNRYIQRSVSAGYFVIDSSVTDDNGSVNTEAPTTVPNTEAPTTRSSTFRPIPAFTGNGKVDTQAPARISDLRVLETSAKLRRVTLSWKASGDDLDHDTAKFYEVLMAPTINDFRKHTHRVHKLTEKDVLFGSLVAPRIFGTREYLSVRVPGHGQKMAFAVVAVDEAGNKGEHSNYVTVGLGVVPDVKDRRLWHQTQFEPTIPASSEHSAVNARKVWAEVVCGLAVVVVLVLFIMVVFTCTRKPRGLKSKSSAIKLYFTKHLKKDDLANNHADETSVKYKTLPSD